MKQYSSKTRTSHQHGGLHYAQNSDEAECVDSQKLSAALGDSGDTEKGNAGQAEHKSGQEQNSDEQASSKAYNESEASFSRTIQSLAALVASKLAKANAFKELIGEQLKLSLSAMLLSACLVLATIVVVLSLWLGISVGAGIVLFHVTQSLVWSVLLVFSLNIILLVSLLLVLKKTWSLVGISSIVSANTRAK